MAKKYDDFDEPDQDGVFAQISGLISNRKREFAIVSVVAALILLGIVVFGGYPDEGDTATGGSAPIVRADADPYKTTPDNPGGMEIPYRDSTVFAGNSAEQGTENILADESAEEPLPRAELFAGLNTEGQPQADAPAAAGTPAPGTVAAVEPPSDDALVREAIGVPAADTITQAAAEPQKVAPIAPSDSGLKPILEAAPAQKQAEAAKPAETVKPAETKAVKAEPKEEAPAKVEPAAGAASAAKAVQPGGFYIQLASVKSLSGAPAEYKKLQAKYSGLAGVDYRTQAADLGAKGTFHRIQAGPMSKDSATSICNQIKKATPGGCLVVAK
ncbi:MAG: hypothetical protein DI626_02705 [Micavibrio aeruginosavorus]|uniref:SPOR domain-containing protein n=1 Tax=Micavibrio aeruginosavorus TaxID=349221 RepID=A0A2W5BY40_9BACT|nr:MAG: hypothetical protein DI626_02705 [Micavibrio aeruginosavorus]